MSLDLHQAMLVGAGAGAIAGAYEYYTQPQSGSLKLNELIVKRALTGGLFIGGLLYSGVALLSWMGAGLSSAAKASIAFTYNHATVIKGTISGALVGAALQSKREYLDDEALTVLQKKGEKFINVCLTTAVCALFGAVVSAAIPHLQSGAARFYVQNHSYFLFNPEE